MGEKDSPMIRIRDLTKLAVSAGSFCIALIASRNFQAKFMPNAWARATAMVTPIAAYNTAARPQKNILPPHVDTRAA